MRRISVLLIALVVVRGSLMAQGRAKPRITGLYSNMAFTPSGDLGGVLFFVSYGADSFYVNFQMAEGTPDAPLLISVQVKDSTISFAFPAGTKYSEGLRTFTRDRQSFGDSRQVR